MTTEEIYNAMMTRFAAETGLEASGSGDLAVRMWAVAAQVGSLYAQAQWVARQCFPQTAQGEWLDKHAVLRGVERHEAGHAVGVLRFSVDEAHSEDLVIDKGTTAMTAGLVQFETTEEGVIPAGSLYADVPAQAVEAGTAGNVGEGTILTMSVPPVGVRRCANPAPFAGGTDREEDEPLRARVLETYKRLPNGANAAFYEQGALTFDRVAAAAVVPRARGRGTVDVVVAVTEGAPDQELLDQIAAYFTERREIAVDVAVTAPEEVAVEVSVSVAAGEGYDWDQVSARVEETIRGWFTGALLGKSILRAELMSRVFAVEGVANCAVLSPAADVVVGQAQLPVAVGITVTEME